MIFGMFSVFDVKAEVFSQPVMSMNTATMMRSCSDLLLDRNHPYAKHSEDYVLYELGRFDDQSGSFEALVAPKSLCVLRDLISKEV